MENKSKIWYGGFAFTKAFIFEHPINQLTEKYFKHLKTKRDWAERHGGRPHGVKSTLKKGKPWLF